MYLADDLALSSDNFKLYSSLYKQKGDLKDISSDMIKQLLPQLDESMILFGKTKFFAKD